MLKLNDQDYEVRGPKVWKLNLDIMQRPAKGKLILVTSINPTPAGEGKTTLNIGLSMGLNAIGESAISALREPSMGPNFGLKGAATGGGQCTVEPSEMINLHFTGDFHAITSAHNLLAAFVDNHIFHGNELGFESVVWHRVVDMNDRALRRVTLASGRQSQFDITVTSEVMAILCLSESYDDLETRISKIVVGYTAEGKQILAQDVDAIDSMMILLKDALKPNLVETCEGTPAIIHGGPFANIAHGCNSLIATKTALALGDWVVTEAGFGADLGAEKFLDIKCRQGNLSPYAVVVVLSVRALKIHGGVGLKDLDLENLEAVQLGWKNAEKHINNMKLMNQTVVLALNEFDTDSEAEKQWLRDQGCIGTRAYQEGGKGCTELAQALVALDHETPRITYAYDLETSYPEKIKRLSQTIYGAKDVEIPDELIAQLNRLEDQNLQICVAKTQYSLSDDPTLLGVPTDFTMKVSDVRLAQGAGFVVIYMGRVLTMPGLPKVPRKMNR